MTCKFDTVQYCRSALTIIALPTAFNAFQAIRHRIWSPAVQRGRCYTRYYSRAFRHNWYQHLSRRCFLISCQLRLLSRFLLRTYQSSLVSCSWRVFHCIFSCIFSILRCRFANRSCCRCFRAWTHAPRCSRCIRWCRRSSCHTLKFSQHSLSRAWTPSYAYSRLLHSVRR